jgi:16S rRNA (cytidine1402-2'-O)-methyltransferase
VALVVGAGRPLAADIRPAVAAVRRLVEAGARPRVAASVVADLTGIGANALYAALTSAD